MKSAPQGLIKIDRGFKKVFEDTLLITEKIDAGIQDQIKAFGENKPKLNNCQEKIADNSTLKSCIVSLQHSLDELSSGVSKISGDSKKTISDESSASLSKNKGKVQLLSTEIVRNGNEIEKSVKGIKDRLGEDSAVIDNFMNKYNTVIAEDEPSPKSLQGITMYFKLLEKRRSMRAEERKTVLAEEQEHVDAFCAKYDETKTILTEKANSIKSITQKFATMYQDLSKTFEEFAKKIETQASLIDAKDDVAAIATSANLVRYELQPLKFEPIKMPQELMDIVETPKEEMSLPLPYGIARVVRKYKGEDKNQLTLNEGQGIYLLEKPTNEWCLSMIPFSKKIGFAPRAAIAPVGRGSALSTEEICIQGKEGEINIKQGEVVALIKDEKEELLIETLTRSRGRVPSEAFLVLSS